MDTGEFSRQSTDPIDEDSQSLFRSRRRCCGCCFFPSFDRLRTTVEMNQGNSFWTRGFGALMKIREWSELVAGPRWKTFIRRFNRGGGRSKTGVNLQYDPLSYAMNFDEGQNSNFDEEGSDEHFYGTHNFSARYARGSIVDVAGPAPAGV